MKKVFLLLFLSINLINCAERNMRHLKIDLNIIPQVKPFSFLCIFKKLEKNIEKRYSQLPNEKDKRLEKLETLLIDYKELINWFNHRVEKMSIEELKQEYAEYNYRKNEL